MCALKTWKKKKPAWCPWSCDRSQDNAQERERAIIRTLLWQRGGFAGLQQYTRFRPKHGHSEPIGSADMRKEPTSTDVDHMTELNFAENFEDVDSLDFTLKDVDLLCRYCAFLIYAISLLVLRQELSAIIFTRISSSKQLSRFYLLSIIPA